MTKNILSWFGISKQEKFLNVIKSNEEIIRLRTMLANIPSTGVTHEDYLNQKEAFSILKSENEKLIAMNQELIADVHLATEANKTEMTNLKSALELEEALLGMTTAQFIEDKKRLEMTVNQKAQELLASIGCSVDKLPATISTENKSVFSIKTLQQ